MHVRQQQPTSLRTGHFGLTADLPALLVLITDQAARPRHGVDGNYAQFPDFAKSEWRHPWIGVVAIVQQDKADMEHRIFRRIFQKQTRDSLWYALVSVVPRGWVAAIDVAPRAYGCN